MKLAERYQHVLDYFRTNHPIAETELHYANPFELLVAVVLSAQCTDKRVNMVTPALFERFPDADALGAASAEEIFPYIKSVSYPNNKAKHLSGLGKKLISDFNGEVPEAISDLVSLPGVGRKTANVIASVVFQAPAMAVDTHVFRVSRRIGLATGKTPLQVELQLVKHIPNSEIHIAHHWLILHGRYICLARKPKCEVCALTAFCKFASKQIKQDDSKA
jgi:endonuclease III